MEESLFLLQSCKESNCTAAAGPPAAVSKRSVQGAFSVCIVGRSILSARAFSSPESPAFAPILYRRFPPSSSEKTKTRLGRKIKKKKLVPPPTTVNAPAPPWLHI